MSKIIIEDRRKHSYIKPFVYLFLQLIIVAEMNIITFATLPYIFREIIYNASMLLVVYLIHKTFVILRRTKPQKNQSISKSTKRVFWKNLSLSSLTIRYKFFPTRTNPSKLSVESPP